MIQKHHFITAYRRRFYNLTLLALANVTYKAIFLTRYFPGAIIRKIAKIKEIAPALQRRLRQSVRCLLHLTLGLGLLQLPHLSQGLFAQSKSNAHHATAIHGKPKYPPNFKHFAYVNPTAPKNGKVILGDLGSFDSLNPFIIKGESAAGISSIYDTLVTSSLDEHSVSYGLLAETIYYDKSRTWVAFKLRKNAKWHDGMPITPEDVIWTFNTLIEKGVPLYRLYYQDVTSVQKTAENTVRFNFSARNNELPHILGQIAVLPKHYWEKRDFSKTTLTPPLGSGPYKIKNVRAGKSIFYERVKTYWGKDLPVNIGSHNFNEIRYDYYKSLEVLREALRSGKIDFFQENNSKEWATGYNIQMVKNNLLRKELIPNENPQGVQGFIFNLRQRMFQDKRVRAALSYAFDFEWSNRILFYGAYKRATSYFNNSPLAAKGLPNAAELRILNDYKGKIPDEVFTEVYAPPQTDGTGNNRANLKIATALLKEAGWVVKDGVLTHAKTGDKLSFTITLVLPAFERIVAPFIQNLKKLGIQAQINILNTAQYKNILNNFDFDMVVGSFGQSDSPGNEQRDFWTSQAATTQGARNIIGIQNPAIDSLVEALITSKDRTALIAHARALDRILLWNYYIIPHWYIDAFRVLYWDRFGIPAQRSPYNVGFTTWWIDPQKDSKLAQAAAFQR